MDAIKLTKILKKIIVYKSNSFLYYSRYQKCKTEIWCADIIICPIKNVPYYDLFLLNNTCLNQVKWKRRKTIRRLLITLGLGNISIGQTFILDVNQNYSDGYVFGEKESDIICLIDKSNQNEFNMLRIINELNLFS